MAFNEEKINSGEIKNEKMEVIDLPEPNLKGSVSVEEALKERRSIREYSKEALELSEISQLLWAAQGITGNGFRAAPSAGATYPLETYIAIGNANKVMPALYKYNPEKHRLELVKEGDLRKELCIAAVGQEWVEKAGAVIIFTAFFERTTQSYGERGNNYVYMEAGHAAQNVYLQATALGLGTVVIGAFIDEEIKSLMQLSLDEKPLYLMPVGKR